MPFSITLDDVIATEHLGAQLAENAKPGDVIFLRGELGAAKTSLSRGFLRHFLTTARSRCRRRPTPLLHLRRRRE